MGTEETVDRHVRKAVERILEDESLTSGLEDAVAKVLIDWGIAEVEHRGQLAAQVSDVDAQQVVDRAVDRVRRVMKQVAKAADAQGITAPADLSKMLAVTLSQVAAADAAAAAPAPKAVTPEPAAPAPEILLPSAVDLVTPVVPKPEILLPSAVDLVTTAPLAIKEAAPSKPADRGFLARLRRFFGK